MRPSANELDEMIEENQELDFVVEQEPSKTYKLNIDRATIFGYTDGIPAIEQAIYKILNTERYEYLIYGEGYGIECRDLIGEDMLYAATELENRIKDALSYDDRIKEIVDLETTIEGKNLLVSFTALTTEGNINIEKEVNLSYV